jgi:plastocyanin
MRALTGLTALVAALAAGCGGEAPAPAGESPSGPAPAAPAPAADGVDPRSDGLEIALGEWALTAETTVIRPGPVTFVISNRGTEPHGFELEDESGGERVKVETRVLEPGESVRLEVDLGAGVYKLECLVDGHDDLGMEELLEVRPDAPLARERTSAPVNAVSIAGFAYEPRELTVAAGKTVTWTNEDAAEHTVTHEGGAFGSETLGRADTYRRRFDRPGRFEYVCALHPEMRGTVIVTG